MNRRLLSLLVVICLVLSCLPLPTKALTVEKTVYTVTDENPLYNGGKAKTEITTVTTVDVPITLNALTSDYVTEEQASAVIRQAMVDRQGSVSVMFYSTDSNYETATKNVFYAAMKHTGNPVEGDYLFWHYGGYKGSIRRSEKNGLYYYTVTYQVSYYTTAQQETELTTAINKLLNDLNLEGKSDYQKFSTIYDYICSNITYDYEHLGNEDYKLQFSAYASLMHKTSVCQGYANLLYRLLLTVGIDCRLIAGIGNGGNHAWNIVKMGDYYYDVDATWDAGIQPQYYNYCLVSDANFTDHTRDAEYATAAFYAEYPMGSTNYKPTGHSMTAYAAKEATCTTNGNIAYWYCSHCDKYFADANGDRQIAANSWIIPADGHTMRHTPASEATCFFAGNTEYWQCGTCNRFFSDANGINEIEEGSWFTEPHDVQIVSYHAPTETEPGNIAHYYCSKCNKYYIEGQAGFVEVSAEDVILPATGPQIVLGDVNRDGSVTDADASAIKAYRTGRISGSELDMSVADLDGNGKVDVYDAYLIQLFAAGRITKFPVEG